MSSHLEYQDLLENSAYEEPKGRKNIFHGIIIAVIAITCTGAGLPLITMYNEVSVEIIGIWRVQMTLIYLIPVSFIILVRNKIKLKQVLSKEYCGRIVIGATIYTFGTFLSIKGGRLTLMSHVATLSNSGGVFIVLVSIIMCMRVHKFEILGTILVVVGIIVLLFDKSSEKSGSETNIMKGDLLSLASMPLYTISSMINDKARSKLPSMVVFCLFSIVQLFVYGTYSVIVSGQDLEILFSTHQTYGFFGWMQPDTILFSLVVIGLVCGVLGVGSYIYLLEYFPPHITSGIFLLEPFVSQYMGILLGVDKFPSFVTYVGVIFIMFGMASNIQGYRLNQKEQTPKISSIELPNASLSSEEMRIL
ncbi:unnamed protein product [Moneuplotes crassus]|uniref:Uncharacterized protein n=1 Tax=Euplotes crassus TaxID=5936 RepID=A0AAD1UDM2_EUPCR|nr:unnamed protein product [Moneuplotes crassus]